MPDVSEVAFLTNMSVARADCCAELVLRRGFRNVITSIGGSVAVLEFWPAARRASAKRSDARDSCWVGLRGGPRPPLLGTAFLQALRARASSPETMEEEASATTSQLRDPSTLHPSNSPSWRFFLQRLASKGEDPNSPEVAKKAALKENEYRHKSVQYIQHVGQRLRMCAGSSSSSRAPDQLLHSLPLRAGLS